MSTLGAPRGKPRGEGGLARRTLRTSDVERRRAPDDRKNTKMGTRSVCRTKTRVDREGAGESKTGNHMRITRNGSRNGERVRKLARARREIDTKKTSGPHKLRRAERRDEPRFYDGMVRSETS